MRGNKRKSKDEKEEEDVVKSKDAQVNNLVLIKKNYCEI